MIFFKSAFFKRCYIMSYQNYDSVRDIKEEQKYFGFDWLIMKGEKKRDLIALQEWDQKMYCISFPIYKTGTKICSDFSLYKLKPLEPTINVYHIRSKRTVSRISNPIFRYFHFDHIQKIVFIRNIWGVMAIYAVEDMLNYAYITFNPFIEDKEGSIQRDYKLEGKYEINKLSYFKKDHLLYNDYYKVIVAKINYIGARPVLTFVNVFHPFDIVKGIFVSPKNIFFLGYKSVQILGYDEKNELKTTSILLHNHKLGDPDLDATKINEDVFIQTKDTIFSFNYKQYGKIEDLKRSLGEKTIESLLRINKDKQIR